MAAISHTPRLSNTGGSNRNPLVVYTGIDTFYLSVRGAAPDWLESVKCLREEHIAACQAEGEEATPAVTSFTFHGAPLYVQPYAGRSWSAILSNEYLTVQVGRGGVSGISARLRLSALYLAGVGFDFAVSELTEWCELYCPGEYLPSEVHLTRDVCGVDLSDLSWLRQVVTRCRGRGLDGGGALQARGDRHGWQTYQFGPHAAPVSLCVYDKTAELRRSGKLWMRDLWTRAGWDGESPVWRFEFRLTRRGLRSFHQGEGINCPFDLLDALAPVFAYLTLHWFRHVECASDAGEDTRWLAPSSALWRAVSLPFLCSLPCEADARARKRVHDSEKLQAQAMGCAVSAVALLPQVELWSEDEVATWLLGSLYKTMERKQRTFAALVGRARARYCSA